MSPDNSIRFYENGGSVRLIESDSQLLPIDVYDQRGLPADLSGARALFHLMEFSTRTHIWTKEFVPANDPYGGSPGIDYPYTVPVMFSNEDTEGLNGHFIGQLELIDHQNTSKFPFQIEIIVTKNAT
jgi:hypothetical protein